MKEIILIEIISFASLLYSLTSIFSRIASTNEMLLLFLWVVIVATFYSINKSKHLVYRGMILLVFLPLLYFDEPKQIYFILITGILILLYSKTSVLNGTHSQYVQKAKYGFIFLGIAVYARLMTSDLRILIQTEVVEEGISGSLAFAAPFLMLFILTTIMLNRIIRHLEFDPNIKSIRRTNMKYLAGVGLVILTTGVESIRQAIIDGFTKLAYGFLMGISYFFYWITSWIKFEPAEVEQVEEEVEGALEAGALSMQEYFDSVRGNEEAMRFDILAKILGFVLIIVLIYIVYRIFKKSNTSRDDDVEYIEEREQMKKTEKKRKSIFENIIPPKDIGNQIRFHYRKFLRKVEKAEIELTSSDTSLDINERAKGEFGEEVDEIREIYIDSRYGNKKVDKESVEKIKSLYKNL